MSFVSIFRYALLFVAALAAGAAVATPVNDAGNVLPNPGFELGWKGWAPAFAFRFGGTVSAIHGQGGWEVASQLTKGDAFDGDTFLKIDLPRLAGKVFSSDGVEVAPGSWRVTVHARALSGRARLSVKCAGKEQRFALSSEWRPYGFDVDIPRSEKPRNIVHIEFTGPGGAQPEGTATEIHIDQVSLAPASGNPPLEEGGKGGGEGEADQAGQTDHRIEAAAYCAEDVAGVVNEGGPLHIDVHLYSRAAHEGLALDCELLDFSLNRILHFITDVKPLGKGAVAVTRIDLGGRLEAFRREHGYLPMGLMVLDIGIRKGDAIVARTDQAIALLPAAAAGGEASRFGNEFMPNDRATEVARKSGAGWLKLMDSGSGYMKWNLAEHRKGTVLFDTFDRRADRDPAAGTLGENIDFLAQIRRLRACGFELTGSLWTTPPWAARPDQGRLPDHRLPRDWMDWDHYVTTMLGHYKEAVKYWEIWNEPGWWGSLPERGTPEDYLEMVRRTSRLIRRIDPSAKVIATDYHRSPRVPIPSGYYGEIARHVDIYSYHHYWAWDASDSAAEVDAWLARRAELQKGNPAIILWNTEGGVNGVDWYNHYTGELAGRINHSDFARRPAALCARLFLHSFALGTEKVFYYQIGSARSFAGDYNFVPGNAMSGNLGFPRPGGVAYAVLAAHLSGARFLRAVPIGEACERLVFSLPDGRAFAAAWIKTEKRPGSILKFNTARPGRRAQTGDVFGTFRPLPDAAAVVALKAEPTYWIFEGEKEATDYLASLVPLPGQESGAAGDDYAEPFEFASQVLTERWFFVDLEPFANARFHDDGRVPGKTGWTRQGPDNDLDALAPGIHRYHGVPFRIPDDSENNACIVLGGHRTVSDNIRKVDIPVNRTSRAFYFMVAAAWVQSWTVGSFSIRYADGMEESLALSRRINIDDWANRPPVRNDEARYVRVACEGGTKERYVYVVQWVNPHPEKRVASLVFEAPAAVNAIPILLAVTGTEN